MSDQYDKYVDLIEVNHSDLYGASLNYGSARKAVEQAVLAERKRCAVVAESSAPLDHIVGTAVARGIAKKIMKDPTCPA